MINKGLFEGPVGDYCIARNTIKCLLFFKTYWFFLYCCGHKSSISTVGVYFVGSLRLKCHRPGRVRRPDGTWTAFPHIIRCLKSIRSFRKSSNKSAFARPGTARCPSRHRPMFFESKCHRSRSNVYFQKYT